MTAQLDIDGVPITFDLSRPIDLSIPLSGFGENPVAWYLEKPEISPVRVGDWVGKVSLGASTNFNNVWFNPHAHGTHTECLGHISRDFYSINQNLKTFFFPALLITIDPEKQGGDRVITVHQVKAALRGKQPTALIIRTLPNGEDKLSRNYSHSNPPYLDSAAATFIREQGTEHLLVDLPSVDREQDQGKLLSHKAFWNVKDIHRVNDDARFSATITELIFVPDDVDDGDYLLNLQIAPFENDAAPSKPVLYPIIKKAP